MHSIQRVFFLAGLFWSTYCTDAPKTPSAPLLKEPTGPTFHLSTARPVTETDPQRNWCLADFDAVETLGAEEGENAGRFLYLYSGITWLAIGDDLGRANLFLRPKSDGSVEVFTGAHFPRCLSRPEYVQLSFPTPNRLSYDNGQHVRFWLEVTAGTQAPKIGIRFPPDRFFAITAVRCSGCR